MTVALLSEKEVAWFFIALAKAAAAFLAYTKLPGSSGVLLHAYAKYVETAEFQAASHPHTDLKRDIHAWMNKMIKDLVTQTSTTRPSLPY